MQMKDIFEIVNGIKQMNTTMGEALSWLLGIVKGESYKQAKKMPLIMLPRRPTKLHLNVCGRFYRLLKQI